MQQHTRVERMKSNRKKELQKWRIHQTYQLKKCTGISTVCPILCVVRNCRTPLWIGHIGFQWKRKQRWMRAIRTRNGGDKLLLSFTRSSNQLFICVPAFSHLALASRLPSTNCPPSPPLTRSLACSFSISFSTHFFLHRPMYKYILIFIYLCSFFSLSPVFGNRMKIQWTNNVRCDANHISKTTFKW